MKLVVSVILLCGLLITNIPLFAAEEEISKEGVAANPTVPVEPMGLRQDRILASQLVDSDAKWLKAGKSEFLGIFNPDSSGAAKGSLLILAAPGHSPITPGILPKVASELSKKGWHTLGISLPELAFSGPAPKHPKSQTSADETTKPKAEANTETSKSASDASKLPDRAKWYADQQTSNMQKLLERILAAETELLSKGGKYVLLAQGVTAELVLELISSKVIKPSGLISLNIAHPVGQRAKKIPTNLAAITVPVLDIYNGDDLDQAIKRKQKQKAARYRQVFIPANEINFRGSEPILIKRIKGWLNKNF